jgi:hypothetical protein
LERVIGGGSTDSCGESAVRGSLGALSGSYLGTNYRPQ